jgi:hypothetical protein
LKFIWYVVALVACFAALVAYHTIKPHPAEKNIAITINQKHITNDDFNARFASVKTSPHNSDKQEFINSLIVKELMIQDAEKEGIDKDEAFRRSIQDYYEQSLIKQVMDKKIKSLKVAVTDAEIDHFASFQNSTLTLTVFNAVDETAAKKGQFRSQELRTVRVSDLAGDMGDRLAALQTGGMTAPACSEAGCDVYRLDSAAAPPSEKLSAESRDRLRGQLLERKRQSAMDSWIADLRAKSDIKISIK